MTAFRKWEKTLTLERSGLPEDSSTVVRRTRGYQGEGL